jgi:hypothetical protein
MTCNTFRAQLAELIGGELDPARHAAAVEHLKTCPDCRAHAGGLEAAAEAVQATLLSHEEALRQTAGLTAPHAVRGEYGEVAAPPSYGISRSYSRTPWLTRLVRYAAMIMVAFAAGFMYGSRQLPEADLPVPIVVDPAMGIPVQPTVNPVYVWRFAQASKDYPDSSTLSRSLLSLASQ